MNFGGIIAGAMEGGAKAVQGMAQGHIDDERKLNFQKVESEIAAAREKALATHRADRADADRKKRADDIGQRSRAIIDDERSTAVTAAGTSEVRRDAATSAPVTDEQRSSAYERAATEGGYLEPKDVVSGNRRASALESQNQRLRDNLESREREGAANRGVKVSEGAANRESRAAIAQQRFEQAMKSTEGKTTRDRATTIMNSASAAISQLERKLENMPSRDKEARAKVLQEIESYSDLRREASESLQATREGGGAPATPPAAPTAPKPKPTGGGVPAPKTRAEYDALPKGARYEAPDGSMKIKG